MLTICSHLSFFACSIIPFSFRRMSAARIELPNPFFRPNPYYVPQRYYSQEKVVLSTHNHYSPYRSAVKDDRSWAEANAKPLPTYQNTRLNVSRVEPQKKEGQTLKRKNINSFENPFHRKYLIPTAGPTLVEDEYTTSAAEARYMRVMESRKVQQQPLENNYMKMPSLKSLPSERDKEKENRLTAKHLSSELKLKLKSQAEIQPLAPIPSTLSCRNSKEGLMTLGRQERSNDRLPSIENQPFPSIIIVKNRQFYLQEVL